MMVMHGVSETVIGVLGGGQLGRMLCQAGSKMALKIVTLDPMENCPASSLSYQHVVGDFNDSQSVCEFAKRSVGYLHFLYSIVRSCIGISDAF
jgi:phosphoribosylaminoimidazole carboxylase